MNARNDWTNPASFASSASGTATWNGFRGLIAFGYCGIPFNSETEEIALTPNENGTVLTGTFSRSVNYTDATVETQRMAVEMTGGGGF
jgi:hypothetical protein